MHRKLLFLFVAVTLLWQPLAATAQSDNAVSGTVIAGDDHQPLPGVSIQWKGKDIGSATNNDGYFDFHFSGVATPQDSLVFSFVGFESKTYALQNLLTNSKKNIELNPSSIAIGEVVITSLSLRQILDSVNHTNIRYLASPAMLNGYYREFVFSNEKCTQYADAIYNYHFNGKTKDAGTLNIAASRCMRAPKPKNKDVDYDHYEIFPDSRVDPNDIFDYAFWGEMQKKYFPAKELSEYTYTMETGNDGNVLIQVDPKKKSLTGKYSLTIRLRPDFTLIAYRLYLSDEVINRLKVKRFLGLAGKKLKFTFDVRYLKGANGIYPQYFAFDYVLRFYGKMLGVTTDENIEQRSEGVVTAIKKSGDNPEFESGGVYKKGNICKNGQQMNDDLLKNYTVIQPSAKEKAVIDGLELQ